MLHTATKYALTSQVAEQQGKCLSRVFVQLHVTEKYENELETATTPEEKAKKARKLQKAQDIKPFHYSHQGFLCYIGSDKTIADLLFGPGNLASGSVATYAFWRSVYISNLFSAHNKWLVITNWTRKTFRGLDIFRE